MHSLKIQVASSSSASCSTCSGVKPKCWNSSGAGADLPKVSRPQTRPAEPTQRYQPSLTPASMATRRLTAAGSTDSRYAASCAANTVVDGMDTTRTPWPWPPAALPPPAPAPLRNRLRSGSGRSCRHRAAHSHHGGWPRSVPVSAAAPAGPGGSARGCVGPLSRSMASCQATAVSTASQGRQTHMFGISRRLAVCSTG